MSAEPELFRINPQTRESEKIEKVEFAELGFRERRDIQEWIAANPSILGEDLLIICKEFSGFDRTRERLDLLAVDQAGKLVVIELKRDDTGVDAHWQAIKYASYLRRASAEIIIDMLANFAQISEGEAGNILVEHLNHPDSLEAVNADQRIILASRRFAPEVTSAALWLNEQATNGNLITCVQLTPYRDGDSLYLQATTIIPTPGMEDYMIGIGSSPDGGTGITSHYGQRKENEEDAITHFMKKVADCVVEPLRPELRPNRRSRHAGGWGGGELNIRYYRLWYGRSPWHNRHMCYSVHLNRRRDDEVDDWPVEVRFQFTREGKNARLSPTEVGELQNRLNEIRIDDDQMPIEGIYGGISVGRSSNNLDDHFAGILAQIIRLFIEQITPLVNGLVNDFEEMRNQEDA